MNGLNEVDKAIVCNLETLCQQRKSTEDELFGKSVGCALAQFSLRQKAMAKTHIQNNIIILMDIEFPESS